ncbi:MAG: CAP domain-containing protein [Candidatus Acetothermia bacterium]|jgi:uncharacterized protein YkwD|nr:CAP domain-containing protein [Candidatus Acetothermia bacterium]MDH7504539.1 CAP domain-containing protein [Candidatus Acetothermia bacterium]
MRRLLQALLLCAMLLLGSVPSLPALAATVEQAVDRNGSCVIDDAEILWAVEYWVTGEPVPGTGGLTISDAKILELVGLWISGESVCSAPTGHVPEVANLSIEPDPAVGSDCAHGIKNYFDLIISFRDPQRDVIQALIHWTDGEAVDYTEAITAQDNAARVYRSVDFWICDNYNTMAFTVVLVDRAGNRSAPFTKRFSVVRPGQPADHTPRILDLSIDPDPAVVSDCDREIYNYFDVFMRFTDEQRDVTQALVHTVWPNGESEDDTLAITTQDNASGTAELWYDWWACGVGTLSLTVVLVDSAGNRSQPFTRSFSVVSGGPGPADHTPVITGINCQSEIPVGQTATCSVGFADPQGDIVEARFVKVAGSPGSTSFDPGVYGRTSGSFSFNIECSSPTAQQTMEVTLRDAAGNQSGPARFSYTCVEAGPQDVAQVFLGIINQYRSQSGQCWDMLAQSWVSWPASAARNLALSSPLNNAAVYHSQFMADHDCFDHVCPGEADVRTRIERFGYTGWTSYGENIYKAPQGLETPEAAFEAWRNSSGHNKNMLTCQFEEIGVGRVYDANSGYWYWTTDFGSR